MTLSHECGHVDLGHSGTTPRQERQADAWAAERLIDPEDYRRAELIVGPDLGRLAAELDVTPWVVQAWRDEAARRAA